MNIEKAKELLQKIKADLHYNTTALNIDDIFVGEMESDLDEALAALTEPESQSELSSLHGILSVKYDSAQKNLKNNPDICGGEKYIKGFCDGLLEAMSLCGEHKSTMMRRNAMGKGDTVRTQKEIVEQVERKRNSDFLGFEVGEYISFLEFKYAKPYLKKGVKKKEWHPNKVTRRSILRIMKNYMPFAWEKANNCRGISAGRSISHYVAWLWMLGDDFTINEDYEFYGKDELKKICDHFGWDSSQWDDGVRVNSESERDAS